MKRILSLLVLPALVAAGCNPQESYKEVADAVPAVTERAKLVGMFTDNTKAFNDAISGLSEAQWTFRESPDRWSIAEVAEHIIIAEGLFTGMTEGTLAGEPNAAMADSVKVTDEQVVGMLGDRTQTFDAPPQAQPTGVYKTPAEAKAAFAEARAKTVEVLKTDKDLRAYFAPHPAIGVADPYKLLLFEVAHANRHLDQIKQVKADANYPAAAAS